MFIVHPFVNRTDAYLRARGLSPRKGEDVFDIIRSGELSKVKAAIPHKWDVNSTDTRTGQTLLHIECGKSLPDIAIISYLMASGADTSREDNNGLSPFYTLCDNSGDPEGVQILRNALPPSVTYALP